MINKECPVKQRKECMRTMSRRHLDMSTYPRLDHFRYFLGMNNPFVNVTVQVDLTDWLPQIRKAGFPFFLSFQYAVVRAANRVPEFRQRILDEGIVEYDFCSPSYTYGLPNGTYCYCLVNANQPLADYLAETKVKQEAALHAQSLEEEGDILSQLFISCVPWVNYTELDMPWSDNRFSIPNFVWGSCRTEKQLCLIDGRVCEKDRISIPLTIFVNHALVDGRHIGQFLSFLEEELRDFGK